MFRSSALVRSMRRNVASASASTCRSFSYQKQFYVKSFEDELTRSDPAIARLRDQLAETRAAAARQPNLARLAAAFRQYGHLEARTNPLGPVEPVVRSLGAGALDPAAYGLERADSTPLSVAGVLHGARADQSMTVAQAEEYLKRAYSSEMALECEHLLVEEEKLWLAREFELLGQRGLDAATRVSVARLLLRSQVFDHFLAAKFPTFKRYSLEGGESAMAFYDSLFQNSAQSDLNEMIMGIAHRGRLNLMTLMLGLPPTLLFTKLKGKSEFAPGVNATGDISHHFPCSIDLAYGQKSLHVSLLPNPSHLEAVDPLVLGKARSRQMYARDGLYAEPPSTRSHRIASLLVHGDGAFAGQGIVPETFQLSRLPGFAVGGTVHLIINNQVAFTLPSTLGRSGDNTSDVAKSVGAPILRINGDHPEEAVKAAEIALRYRNLFGKDIVVEMLCFRKYGHNELDEPMFTNPLIYQKVNARQSVPDAYQARLVAEGVLRAGQLDAELGALRKELDEALARVDTYQIEPRNTYLRQKWSGMDLPSTSHVSTWATGVSVDFLRHVGAKSVELPKDFALHATVERAHVKKRLERISSGRNIDWSTAEALAFGSLLMQDFNVRLCGQDVGRGTFSQRHAMLVDQATGRTHIPLNAIDAEKQRGFLEICNSNLSEEAVMGFEYGFSLDDPRNLAIWEAQFGDFFNGAQIIIDTFIATGETKWLYQSGLVLMLPHGFDGAASEHSSCRIERFLQQTSSKEDAVDADAVNMYVANPTTPANYFHLLRRQMVAPFRKPLVMAAPKGLLRLPECVSSLEEMGEGTTFQPVLDDPTVKQKSAVKKLIFVSGKLYYELLAEKQKRSRDDTALVRLEQLCPFPAHEIRAILGQYKNAKQFVYAQEEHRNMGAHSFVAPRFENVLGVKLKYAGRPVAATISGIGSLHKKELADVLSKPFEI